MYWRYWNWLSFDSVNTNEVPSFVSQGINTTENAKIRS